MRTLVFDSGPVISFALNGLLWLLFDLNHHYHGKFVIPPSVRKELVERPVQIRRFQLEAFQVLELINSNVLNVSRHKELIGLSNDVMAAANRIFFARNHPISIIHKGETQVLALAKLIKADAIVVDERTTRMLLENPKSLQNVLANKLHTRVKFNCKALSQFNKLVGKMPVIRSVELATVAFELGLLDRYLEEVHSIKQPRHELLEGLLWAMKLKGATVSEREIDQILKQVTQSA